MRHVVISAAVDRHLCQSEIDNIINTITYMGWSRISEKVVSFLCISLW